jgi:ssDNA-binding replication factor A large subunit
MPIKDLQPKQGNVEVEAVVVDKKEAREFNKFGKTGRVCNATIKDSTGKMALTLWNEQVDQVKVGDRIKVTNGYVNEWQGEMQLSTGRFGKIEVLASGEAIPNDEPSQAAAPAKPAKEQEISSDELEEESDDEPYAEEEDID